MDLFAASSWHLVASLNICSQGLPRSIPESAVLARPFIERVVISRGSIVAVEQWGSKGPGIHM